MDVTATRQAEEALHIAQTELAHVTRVTTLGEMSASIAHEVNQPLAAIVTNGEASLRWLGRGVPEINEALDATRNIVSEAHRASEVIRRNPRVLPESGTGDDPNSMSTMSSTRWSI